MRILKELRKSIKRNSDYCKKKKKKELETINRNQEKLENSFGETEAELKAMDSRMNNAKERTIDLKDRIMEITQ